jgi:hypothetical protein
MPKFNNRTHAIALTVAGAAVYAAHWFLNHQAQLAAVAQWIVNHPISSVGSLVIPLLAALYHPSTN